MRIIHHRVNTVDLLSKVPKSDGIELDIRYHENNLILDHDPFDHQNRETETFENLLKSWSHEGPMILNIKSEGIEEECINLIKKYQVKNWFFLDLSMPYFVKYFKKAEANSLEGFSKENLAVRFSDFEPIEYALSFSKGARWVWVDCFNGERLSVENYNILKEAGFRLCLVSPELQQYSIKTVKKFSALCSDISVDAVCTKHPNLWAPVESL